MVLGTPSRNECTENAFRCLWVWQIREALRSSFPAYPYPIRNSNHHTTTALKWPDFSFLLDGTSRKRPPGSSKGPKQESLLKLIRTYGPPTSRHTFLVGEWLQRPFVRGSTHQHLSHGCSRTRTVVADDYVLSLHRHRVSTPCDPRSCHLSNPRLNSNSNGSPKKALPAGDSQARTAQHNQIPTGTSGTSGIVELD
jgi:hypothetical protein